MFNVVNPMEAGGSESMYSLGGWPPLDKPAHWKKLRPIILIVCELGKVEKNAKKKVKKVKNIFLF